jgi:pyruvate/2-oxoglutarate dehydrogenase complex dihydrolipoamide dehydrogenase (E3) component
VTHVVVLGGGSAGEAFVGALRRLDGDVEITLVERALVGGECTYWACMPSKTLLRAPELLAAAREAPGAAEATVGALDLERIFWWRDQVVDSWEDEGHGEWLADRDTTLVRGDASVAAPGVLEIEGRELQYDKLVVATGSRPALPPVDGIADVPHWTTADATGAPPASSSRSSTGASALRSRSSSAAACSRGWRRTRPASSRRGSRRRACG